MECFPGPARQGQTDFEFNEMIGGRLAGGCRTRPLWRSVTLFRSRKSVAGTLGFTDYREFMLDVPVEDVLGGPLQV